MPSRIAPLPFVPAQVEEVPHLEAAAPDGKVDDLLAPLGAAAGVRQRVDHQRAVGMEAHPVVGEHRIGLAAVRTVLGDAHLDALAGQRAGELLELAPRGFGISRGGARSGVLEGVGGGGLGVEAEGLRTHHQHRARALGRSCSH